MAHDRPSTYTHPHHAHRISLRPTSNNNNMACGRMLQHIKAGGSVQLATGRWRSLDQSPLDGGRTKKEAAPAGPPTIP